ncbi:hypothetical protein NDU88_003365 [Pleurodeles waltl]|uniref:Uncharacterized protein n=1 Tax=Pleurodeles waltl TaxID=8319 RepID=A0AAV7TQX6_PLEWA|nr:hypothetical protein NDU88_003365 [Pleurodeles waltl]
MIPVRPSLKRPRRTLDPRNLCLMMTLLAMTGHSLGRTVPQLSALFWEGCSVAPVTERECVHYHLSIVERSVVDATPPPFVLWCDPWVTCKRLINGVRTMGVVRGNSVIDEPRPLCRSPEPQLRSGVIIKHCTASYDTTHSRTHAGAPGPEYCAKEGGREAQGPSAPRGLQGPLLHPWRMVICRDRDKSIY